MRSKAPLSTSSLHFPGVHLITVAGDYKPLAREYCQRWMQRLCPRFAGSCAQEVSLNILGE